MIPIIGLMMGAYIITRLSATFTQPDVNIVAKILGGATIAITLFCLFALIAGGASVGHTVPRF